VQENTLDFLLEKVKIDLWPSTGKHTTLIGRSMELEELHELFEEARPKNFKVQSKKKNDCSEDPRTREVMITGVAGVGKSAILHRYLQINRTDFTHILWLDARSIRSIQRSFLECLNIILRGFEEHSKHLDLPPGAVSRYLGLDEMLTGDLHLRGMHTSDDYEIFVDAVIEFLGRDVKSRWALVLDNYKDSFEITKFIPQSRIGQVILISQSSNSPFYPLQFHLKGMQEHDGLELLASSSFVDSKAWNVAGLCFSSKSST
jgi:hypothetical protein